MGKLNFLKNYNSQKLLIGALSLILVAGMTSPAFAGGIQGCIIEPASAVLEITENAGSDHVEKKITCPLPLNDFLSVYEVTCANYEVSTLMPVLDVNMITFTEQVTHKEGPLVTEHCEVTFQIMGEDNNYEYLTQELWIDTNQPIGGTVGSMSTTSLLVAGAQSNMGLWSLALVGIVGAAAAITYKVKSMSEQ
jgi:hypothetical protein